jgi:hypothetical protein
MNALLRKCLDDLAKRIDEEQEQQNRQEWLGFLNSSCEAIFTPSRRTVRQPKVEWPMISVNAAFNDDELMVLHQFAECSTVLAKGGNSRLNIRCNYGSSIIPSLFGAELFMMDEQTNTLPTSRPLGGERLRRLLDTGVPDIGSALGAKVFMEVEIFLEVLDEYPVLNRNIHLYHPDVQGPIDILEVLWGSDIFYAFYDEPQMVRDLLELVTQTYSMFMRRWQQMVPPRTDMQAHWGFAHKGTIMLRNDSLVNLPPGIYNEFIRPMDQRLLDEFSGGAVHFCGHGDHMIDELVTLRGLTAINISQPQLNDMDRIYRCTVERRIKILGMQRCFAESAAVALAGQVHCPKHPGEPEDALPPGNIPPSTGKC